jgi:hypothetical protein
MIDTRRGHYVESKPPDQRRSGADAWLVGAPSCRAGAALARVGASGPGSTDGGARDDCRGSSLDRACHDPGILSEQLKQATQALVPAYRRANQVTRLTEREVEVLRVLAAGATEAGRSQPLRLARHDPLAHEVDLLQA